MINGFPPKLGARAAGRGGVNSRRHLRMKFNKLFQPLGVVFEAATNVGARQYIVVDLVDRNLLHQLDARCTARPALAGNWVDSAAGLWLLAAHDDPAGGSGRADLSGGGVKIRVSPNGEAGETGLLSVPMV